MKLLSSQTQLFGRLMPHRKIWMGVAAGLGLCLCIGAIFIGVFYGLGSDLYSHTEDLWEGIFSIVATVIITVMGAAMLRISKLQDKWRVKLAKALANENLHKRWYKRWAEKYAMFLLPFITVLREGLEAVVFIGGVSLGYSATAFPLAVACGLGGGILIGYLIYRWVPSSFGVLYCTHRLPEVATLLHCRCSLRYPHASSTSLLLVSCRRVFGPSRSTLYVEYSCPPCSLPC